MLTSPVNQGVNVALTSLVKEIDLIFEDRSDFTQLSLENQFGLLHLLSRVITLQNNCDDRKRESDNIRLSLLLQRELSEVFDGNIQNQTTERRKSSDHNRPNSTRSRAPERT